MELIKRKELGRLLGINEISVIYYEKMGLIKPAKTFGKNGWYKRFKVSDVDLINNYRKLAKHGKLKAIKSLI